MKEIILGFKNLKALVVGDVMVDTYLMGDVNRISPEAPVPVVTLKEKENRLGGAGNVAMNINSLGGKAVLCAVTGNDQDAVLLKELMKKNDMDTSFIFADENRITSTKSRIISQGQHLIRIDNEVEIEISESIQKNIFSSIKKNINDFDVIIFQDYDKGMLTKNLIQNITEFAAQNNIPVTVDPKRKNFLHYKNATLFKPNLKELQEGLNVQINKNDLSQMDQIIDKLRNDINMMAVMITLSDKGIYINDGKNRKVIPTPAKNIIDVSGAGDTVISIASLCLAMHVPLEKTAMLSNIAAGIVCEQVGVVPVDKNILLHRLNY